MIQFNFTLLPVQFNNLLDRLTAQGALPQKSSTCTVLGAEIGFTYDGQSVATFTVLTNPQNVATVDIEKEIGTYAGASPEQTANAVQPNVPGRETHKKDQRPGR